MAESAAQFANDVSMIIALDCVIKAPPFCAEGEAVAQARDMPLLLLAAGRSADTTGGWFVVSVAAYGA